MKYSDAVDWAFIRGLYEFTIYGGRLENDFDSAVLKSYLKRYLFFNRTPVNEISFVRSRTSTFMSQSNYQREPFWKLTSISVPYFQTIQLDKDSRQTRAGGCCRHWDYSSNENWGDSKDETLFDWQNLFYIWTKIILGLRQSHHSSASKWRGQTWVVWYVPFEQQGVDTHSTHFPCFSPLEPSNQARYQDQWLKNTAS